MWKSLRDVKSWSLAFPEVVRIEEPRRLLHSRASFALVLREVVTMQRYSRMMAERLR